MQPEATRTAVSGHVRSRIRVSTRALDAKWVASVCRGLEMAPMISIRVERESVQACTLSERYNGVFTACAAIQTTSRWRAQQQHHRPRCLFAHGNFLVTALAPLGTWGVSVLGTTGVSVLGTQRVSVLGTRGVSVLGTTGVSVLGT